MGSLALKHAIRNATLLHTTVVCNKVALCMVESFFCMLHETCCLELDQWSNQAAPLHRVWHALEHAHLHCPFHVRDCVLQHHNEVLAELTGVSTRLEVRGDVVANNHV